MDGLDRPDLLISGTTYKGPPASTWELFDSVAESTRVIDSHQAKLRRLEEYHDRRNDELEKAGLSRLYNPMRDRVPAHLAEEARLYGQREYGPIREELGQRHPDMPWLDDAWQAIRSPKGRLSDDQRNAEMAFLMRRYERDLKEMEEKNPDKAWIIRANRPPLLEVAELAQGVEKRRTDAETSRSEAYSWLNIPQVLLGTGATLGGSLWGVRESPLDILNNMVGPSGAARQSLIRNAMKAALANAAVQAGIEYGNQAQRASYGVDSGLSQAIENILMSGALGGGLDVAVRAPLRGANILRGKPPEGGGQYGGIFRDAPDPAAPAPRPESATPPTEPVPTPAFTLDPDLVARAESGDPAAMREIYNQLPDEIKESSPELRGAIAEAEIDAVAPVKMDGVPEADSLRAFVGTFMSDMDPREPRPRAPDVVPEARSALEPERSARLYDEFAGELDRLMQAAEAKLSARDPRLVQRIDTAIEAGFGEVLPLVEDAVRRIQKGENEAAVANRFVRNVLSLADEVGLDRLAAMTDLHSGIADPLDMARAIRQMPDLIDSNTPLTEQVQLARSLARLSDQAFAMVERGEADPMLAQVVSDHVADPGQHAALLDQIKRAGIDDPDAARRVIPDLLPMERDPDVVALSDMTRIDDPLGKEAKAQTDILKAEYATELAAANETLQLRKQQIEAERVRAEQEAELIQRGVEVRREIENVMGMVPSDFEVKVFTGLGDLPPTMAREVMQAGAAAFREGLYRFQSATSDADRLAARAAMDAAIANRAIEAFVHDDAIWVAAYAMNPQGRVAHEAVHALVKSGRIAPDELSALAAAARMSGAFDPQREALYRRAYEVRDGVDGGRLSEMLDEEAAAHLLESYRGAKLEAVPEPEAVKVDGIIAKIQAFLAEIRDAIGRVLGRDDKPNSGSAKPNSVTDLLDALLSGEIAKREAMSAVMRAEDISALAVRDGGIMAAFANRLVNQEYDPDTGQRITKTGTTPEAEAKWSAILDALPVDKREAAKLERRRMEAVNKRGQVMFAFAGERARTADLDALSKAKAMEADGSKREAIWSDTGWFRAPDGKWKWEIDDSGAQVFHGYLEMTGKSESAALFKDRMAHFEYLQAYPDAASLNVQRISGQQFPERKGKGAYDRRRNAMWFDAANSDRGLSIALHELQHDAQMREGFQSGAQAKGLEAEIYNQYAARINNAIQDGDKQEAALLRAARDALKLNGDRDTYNRLAGEVEARAVQKRMDLTPSERRARPPWLDYDVPEDQQIVRFADGMTAKAGPMFAMRDLAERNNATLIDDIGPDDPHPGRVLAFHSTPFGFDKFSIGRDIGLHFGSAEQATSRMTSSYGMSGARTIPAVLDMQKVVTVSDANDWVADGPWVDAIAKQIPALADINNRMRSTYERVLAESRLDSGTFIDPDMTNSGRGMLYVDAVAARERGESPAIKREAWENEVIRRRELGLSAANIKAAEDLAGAWRALERQYMQSGTFELTIEKIRSAQWDELRQAIVDAGYDGIRYRNDYEGEGWSYIVIKPGTLRSATSGNLMFAMRDTGETNAPDQVSRLTSRLSALAQGLDIPDADTRIAAGLNLIATARQIAAERGIDADPANVVDLAEANASRGLAQVVDLIGPERTAQVIEDIQTALKDVPPDPQAIAARINDVLDQYFPEEPARSPANDNADLGPVSPVEKGMYDIERIGQLIDLIGACRG